MISAVAARKAAKAAVEASVAPSSKPPSPPPSSHSPSSSPKPTTASRSGSKPPSKRKHRGLANTGPPKKKKAKIAHASAKPDRHARYFDPGDTRKGDPVDDVTVEMEVNSESDSSSGEEMEIQMNVPPPVGLSSISFTNTKRAWSPSRPMVDSSDEEESGLPQAGAYDPTTYLTPSTSKKPEPLPLSTFRPVLNGNVYSVPENEDASSGKAVILVLQPNETVALVGTYSLCVLQGGLSLLGVTLCPSDTKHTVFAFRSSPMPVLSWAMPHRQGSCIFPIPPAIRRQPNATAILVEYVHTGVEGLGRICKTFENVFKSPRESDILPGAELPRIHIVCVSQP